MSGVENKVWLITGTSAGFGKSIAQEVLARGGLVVATARNRATLADLEASAPDRVLALTLDVTKPEHIAAAVEAAHARFGRIDVLVNNAGYGFLSGVEEASEAEYRAQLEVNFFGLVAMTRAVLPQMRQKKSGYIVNISSVAGIYGVGGSSYYSASKFALEGLSEALSEELRPFGIGVLIVEPGPFRTEFFGGSIMGPANPMPEYPHTAAVREGGAKGSGKQAGDPVLGARAIIDTVISASPPLRCVLGGGAFDRARKALENRIIDIDKTRDQAKSVDFPPGQ